MIQALKVAIEKLRSGSCFITILGLLIVCLPSLHVCAEENKEVYATEAIRSISAYWDFLAKQRDFHSQLNSDEKDQFRRLHNILRQYELSRFPSEGGWILPFPLKIEFSADQSLFKGPPEEPVRSATTTANLDEPITFNNLRLNRREVSYLDVVQIIVHEIGHKIGAEKKQEAVDSLAAKLRIYLESFYTEKTSAAGHLVQLLSIPFEIQSVRAMGESDLSSINLFVDDGSKVQSINYDFKSHFKDHYSFAPVTPYGSGNFLLNQSYVVRSFELGAIDKPLDINLKLEIQNRWMFLAPETRLEPGPVIDGQQVLIPRNQQTDLISPEIITINVPINAYYNFLGELDFNFINFTPYAWNYPQFKSSFIKIKGQRITKKDGDYRLELEFTQNFPAAVIELSAEITTPDKRLSFLVRGNKVSEEKFIFSFPQNTLPPGIAEVNRLIINSDYQMPLDEVINITSPSIASEEKDADVGPVDIQTADGRIPYSRASRLDIEQVPLELSLPVRFKPLQVRLRWIKSTEFSIKSNQEGVIPIGRLSRVHEEWVDERNFTLIEDGINQRRLVIKSEDVHRPFVANHLHEELLLQEDEGRRELKEILLVGENGLMDHIVLSSNQRIYNNEHLRVKVVPDCEASLAK